MVRPLYLDDERHPTTDRDWVICRTTNDACEYALRHGCPSEISFDHDLGDGVPTGYDFAQWLVATDMDRDQSFIPTDFRYNVHSANPVGAANIAGLLDSYLRFRVSK